MAQAVQRTQPRVWRQRPVVQRRRRQHPGALCVGLTAQILLDQALPAQHAQRAPGAASLNLRAPQQGAL